MPFNCLIIRWWLFIVPLNFRWVWNERATCAALFSFLPFRPLTISLFSLAHFFNPHFSSLPPSLVFRFSSIDANHRMLRRSKRKRGESSLPGLENGTCIFSLFFEMRAWKEKNKKRVVCLRGRWGGGHHANVARAGSANLLPSPWHRSTSLFLFEAVVKAQRYLLFFWSMTSFFFRRMISGASWLLLLLPPPFASIFARLSGPIS